MAEVTRQVLHEVLRNALDSGEWSKEELHAEVDTAFEDWQDDEAASMDDGALD